MSSRDRLLIRLAALSAAGYLTLALCGDLRANPALYLSVHALLFVLYLGGILAVKSDHAGVAGLAWILGAAIVFRLLLLPTVPTLSDDIWRYIWEGGLQLHGINPYRYAPSAQELAPYRDGIYQGINYKDLPSIYPPVMQWAFALGALLGRSVAGMKAVFVAADIALMFVLARLLGALDLPASRILVYAWNPLAVVEVAGTGHNDSLAVCLLVASTVGIIGQRRMLSIGALALAALSKLFPISLLPLYARKVRPADLLIAPVLVAIGYLPYLAAGENLYYSAREYAERWRFNDSVFSVMVGAVDASGVSPVAKSWGDALGLDSLYTQPHMIARGVAALIALAALATLAWRLSPTDPASLPRSIFCFTGLALLFMPAMHPWYLLWILPWLTLFPSPAWLVLSGLAPLAYFCGPWVRWVEYVPFFALLALSQLGSLRGDSPWRRASRLW